MYKQEACNMSEMKHFQNAEDMNQEARKVLKQFGAVKDKYTSATSKKEGTVFVYDTNGVCLYSFNLKTRKIVDNSGIEYPMDAKTYKQVEKTLGIKNNSGCLATLIFFVVLTSVIVGTSIVKNQKQQKQVEKEVQARERAVQARKQAVLNWTDSVNNAKTDIEYQRAFDSLKQAKLRLQQESMSKDDYEY